jgi:ABC-2 type transport system ATP-binding protein
MNHEIEEPCIYMDALTIKVGEGLTVDNFSLSVSCGEKVAILGTETSGKSLLLKTLLGLIRPVSGQASLMDYDIQKDSIKVRKNCGYVPCKPVFDLTITVNDLFHFSAALGREDTDWDLIQSLVDRFKIDPRKKIPALNQSERKLLGTILAFMHHPKVLLLDEPLQGLTEEAEEALISFLEEMDKDQTLLMATSNAQLAGRLCKRVGLMDKGKLLSVVESNILLKQIVRKVEVTFGTKPSLEQLVKMGVVRQLSWEGATLHCLVVGALDPFIRSLQANEVLDFKSREADLEGLIQAICLGGNHD